VRAIPDERRDELLAHLGPPEDQRSPAVRAGARQREGRRRIAVRQLLLDEHLRHGAEPRPTDGLRERRQRQPHRVRRLEHVVRQAARALELANARAKGALGELRDGIAHHLLVVGGLEGNHARLRGRHLACETSPPQPIPLLRA